MAAAKTDKTERYKVAWHATFIAAGVNVLLSVAKILAGIFGNSAAMLADGIHSISDLITDAAVLAGMRIAKQEADRDQPCIVFLAINLKSQGQPLQGAGYQVADASMVLDRLEDPNPRTAPEGRHARRPSIPLAAQ